MGCWCNILLFLLFLAFMWFSSMNLEYFIWFPSQLLFPFFPNIGNGRDQKTIQKLKLHHFKAIFGSWNCWWFLEGKEDEWENIFKHIQIFSCPFPPKTHWQMHASNTSKGSCLDKWLYFVSNKVKWFNVRD